MKNLINEHHEKHYRTKGRKGGRKINVEEVIEI